VQSWKGTSVSHFAPMDTLSSQNSNEQIMDLNDGFDQMDLSGIHKTFHPTAAEYTFFSSIHGTYSRIDHM